MNLDIISTINCQGCLEWWVVEVSLLNDVLPTINLIWPLSNRLLRLTLKQTLKLVDCCLKLWVNVNLIFTHTLTQLFAKKRVYFVKLIINLDGYQDGSWCVIKLIINLDYLLTRNLIGWSIWTTKHQVDY